MMSRFTAHANALEHDLTGEFLKLMDEVDVDSDDDFRTAVRFAIDHLGIPVDELVEAFGISTATVSRWKSGKSRPHRMARPAVYDWLKKKAEEQYRRQGQNRVKAAAASAPL